MYENSNSFSSLLNLFYVTEGNKRIFVFVRLLNFFGFHPNAFWMSGHDQRSDLKIIYCLAGRKSPKTSGGLSKWKIFVKSSGVYWEKKWGNVQLCLAWRRIFRVFRRVCFFQGKVNELFNRILKFFTRFFNLKLFIFGFCRCIY